MVSSYDIILIVTSFTTELATPSITDVRADTLPRLIHKDFTSVCNINFGYSFNFSPQKCIMFKFLSIAFSALTLLAGCQESIQHVKIE